MLRLMLRLSTVDTELILEDMEATMENTVTAEDTMASARLMPNPRPQLNLTTDTKNCGSEEPLFEYIPIFPEAHELTTLQVIRKHSSPLNLCFLAHTYLKHIESFYFHTVLFGNIQGCSSYQILNLIEIKLL